jgi:hypothetical protein
VHYFFRWQFSNEVLSEMFFEMKAVRLNYENLSQIGIGSAHAVAKCKRNSESNPS